MEILQSIAIWLYKHFISFLVIVIILVVGSFIQREMRAYDEIVADLNRLKNLDVELAHFIDDEKTKVLKRVSDLQEAGIAQLDNRIASTNLEMAALAAQMQCKGVFDYFRQCYVHDIKSNIKISMLDQERTRLRELRALTLNASQREKASYELENLRRIHAAIYVIWKTNQSDQKVLRTKYPGAVKLPTTWQHRKQMKLQVAGKIFYTRNQEAHQKYLAQRKIVDLMRRPIPLGPLLISQREIDNFRVALQQKMVPLDQKLRANLRTKLDELWTRIDQPIVVVIPTALMILASVILTPLVIKAFFYFLIAPLASMRKPIQLLPDVSGQIDEIEQSENGDAERTSISSVSQVVTVADTEELLIDPEYIQSASHQGIKDTKWLVNCALPLSSIASGLFALTRFRPESNGAYVIASMKDPFNEVGVISLPRGSAIVIQPHYLIGIVQPRSAPVAITRHWRLGSLHAWLTLQLRYLVFHGPVKMIVKGCRGVRVERAGSGRSINQAATIGFSANLAYTNTRCETFAAYLMGKKELFNDHFPRGPGSFIYEETPHFGKKGGLFGRGLEGLTDSALKIFGI